MIQISESAQAHFRKLIAREDLPGLGVRLAAYLPGTTKADVRLAFAEPADLEGDEQAVQYDGFTLWVDAASAPYLEGAQIDYEQQPTGGRLQIRAPGIKSKEPDPSAPLTDRVAWLIEHEINPQLAMHHGHVELEGVTEDGIVVLVFGGGCHGCGQVDNTIKNGIEKTLFARAPGVTGVRDVTDHDSGKNPYAPRSTA